jgi:RimJ/RimL family protein N-acetyltransferase
LWGMYVIADERRHGVGLELVRAIIALAKGKVEELTLSVAVHNQPAIGLYYRVGFADYGLDRRALRVDNEYVDEILMKLPLKADVPSRPSLMV